MSSVTGSSLSSASLYGRSAAFWGGALSRLSRIGVVAAEKLFRGATAAFNRTKEETPSQTPRSDVSEPPVAQEPAPVSVLATWGRVEAISTVTFTAPPSNIEPPLVKMIICVDISSSMSERRNKSGPYIEAAGRALQALVKEAERQLRTTPERKIGLDVVVFDQNARSVVQQECLDRACIQSLLPRFTQEDLLRCGRGTDIAAGLMEALKGLPSPGSGVRSGLVLLTDGETPPSLESVEAVKTQVAEAGASFLVIQIKGSRKTSSRLEDSLCRNERLRAKYVGLDGSPSGDLSPVVEEISALFQEQLKPQLVIREITVNDGWAVAPLPSPICIAPGGQVSVTLTLTRDGFPAADSVFLSVAYTGCDGKEGTFPIEVSRNGGLRIE